MNIFWIQDNDPRSGGGGAVITDSYFIKDLEKHGHIVKWSDDPVDVISKSTKKIDIAIICNAKWNEKNYSQELRNLLIELKIPWVKHEHDHACKWRAFFPMVDRCQRDDCPAKETYGWQYEEAKGLIYLSPFQKEAHDFWNGFRLKNIETLITPPYIDYPKFLKARKKGNREENTVMLLAGMYKFKGYFTNLNYAIEHPEYTYSNYTQVSQFTQDELATIDKAKLEPKGWLSSDKIAETLADHEMFLHLSDGFLPFERVVLEAFFAGCKVITNKNVGATSYDWWGDVEGSIVAMDGTRGKFREFIEEIAKNEK